MDIVLHLFHVLVSQEYRIPKDRSEESVVGNLLQDQDLLPFQKIF
jgi:hypothetical protein